MKMIATTAVGAALIAGSMAPAQAFPQNLIIGGAIGFATGALVGGAIAGAHAAPRAEAYGYVDNRYGYGSVTGPTVTYRSGPNNCTSRTKYDYTGRPYEWKDCW